MQIRKTKGEYLLMTGIVMFLFAIGVILGAVLVFYTPNNLIYETRLSFGLTKSETISFTTLFKNSFIIEFLWIFAIWLLGLGNITAPLASAVSAVRGLLMGFCVEFIISGSQNIKEVILTGILPQCLFGLPVMCVFTVLCLKFANERRRGGGLEGKYFILGGTFTLISLVMSLIESLIIMLFINII